MAVNEQAQKLIDMLISQKIHLSSMLDPIEQRIYLLDSQMSSVELADPRWDAMSYEMSLLLEQQDEIESSIRRIDDQLWELRHG